MKNPDQFSAEFFKIAVRADNQDDFCAKAFSLVFSVIPQTAGILFLADQEFLWPKNARAVSPRIWREAPIKIGEGELGRLVRAGKSAEITNLTRAPFSHWTSGRRFTKAFFLPLIAHGHLEGGLIVFAKKVFSQKTKESLLLCADLFGLGLATFINTKNSLEANNSEREIKILSDALKTLSHLRGTTEIIYSLLAAATKVSRGDSAFISCYDKQKDSLLPIKPSYSLSEKFYAGLTVKSAEKILGAVHFKGASQIVNHLDEEHRQFFNKNNLIDIRSLMVVPLKNKSQSLGVLTVLSEKEANFRAVDLDLLEKIGQIIASALNESNLTKALSRKGVERTEVISVIRGEVEGENNKQNQKIKQIEEELLAIASHEIKNPLTAVKGYLEMILSGDTGKINDETRVALFEAKSAADRLENLVENLLTVSQLEEDKIKIKPKKFDLAALVGEVAQSFKHQFAQKKLFFVSKAEKSLGVYADPERTREILINLLDNAVKYTHRGNCRIIARRVGNLIEVAISDTGLGITTSDLKNLFTKFYRVRSPETFQIPGTGLGLWIVHNLLTRQGGKIAVVSQKGQGSTFKITLPASK